MKTAEKLWEGIKVKSTTVDPRYDLWQVAYVIGYNPFTKSFIVCDEKGFIQSSLEIRDLDGTELSQSQYKEIIKEIRIVNRQGLANIGNQFNLR